MSKHSNIYQKRELSDGGMKVLDLKRISNNKTAIFIMRLPLRIMEIFVYEKLLVKKMKVIKKEGDG